MKIAVIYTATNASTSQIVRSALETAFSGQSVEWIEKQAPEVLEKIKQLGEPDGDATHKMLCLYQQVLDEGAQAILNVCSTVGAIADCAQKLYEKKGVPLLRIDRAMAQTAVEKGTRIGVLATLHTTLKPTCDLILECARQKGKTVEILPVVVENQFGSTPAEMAQALEKEACALAQKVDVLVLAQASMAANEEEIQKKVAVPVLSSPGLGAQALKRVLEQNAQKSEQILELEQMARRLRLDVMEMVYQAKDGHPGPSFSCADIVTALYFSIMDIDPAHPDKQKRDRFVLSKGHACPVYYAALARRGYFPLEELSTLRQFGSMLQGHPVMSKAPGVDMTSGSLGNGVSVAVGMAMGLKRQNIDQTVYCIFGDGEMQEGIVWEALLSAVNMKANRLILFLDANHWQSGGSVEQVSAVYPDVVAKMQSLGLYTQQIDGHDMAQILQAIQNAKAQTEKPSVIVCNTIKGKGLPFMANDNSWHKKVPTEEQMKMARALLQG